MIQIQSWDGMIQVFAGNDQVLLKKHMYSWYKKYRLSVRLGMLHQVNYYALPLTFNMDSHPAPTRSNF